MVLYAYGAGVACYCLIHMHVVLDGWSITAYDWIEGNIPLLPMNKSAVLLLLNTY